MSTPRSPKKRLAPVARRDKPPAARTARQPTRTLVAGLLWIVFMLVVWFQAPGVRLPTFFQRLVGIADALLTMLVVMFAIREYGKRLNRVPLPLFGRVSTSRIAGAAVFIAVLAWWISPWAPIPAGQPEPDLWHLLEQGLNRPLLQVVDTDLARLVPPSPSLEAQQAAKTFAPHGDPLRSALVAIASSKFDDAEAFLNHAPAGSGADRVREAWAQLDLYRGQYSAASRRYGAMLKIEPRREDFLAHGALAAALGGDYATAAAWAQQLLEQARARSRISMGAVEATNLLAAVRLLAGDYVEAQRLSTTLVDRANGAVLSRGSDVRTNRQHAAAANNAAVIRLLCGGDSGSPSAASGFALARKLWLDRSAARGRSANGENPRAAIAQYNLGAAALYQARYRQAEALLADSLAVWRQFANSPAQSGLAINLNALAQLDLAEGRFSQAESRTGEAAGWFASASPDDPSVPAFKATVAQLDASLARYDRAIASFAGLIHDAELGHGGVSPSHPYVAILKIRLTDALLNAGRNADAAAAAGEAEKILDHAGLGSSRPAADALRIAGLAALRQGNRAQTERQFDRAMKMLRPADENQSSESSAAQPASPELAKLLSAEGELAGDLQNYTAAAEDYRQALDQIDRLFESQAANHRLRAEYLHALAMLLVHQAKPAAAKPLLEESLAIDRRALPPGHPATIAVMEDLANVLAETGSTDAAEALRREAKQFQAKPRDAD